MFQTWSATKEYNWCCPKKITTGVAGKRRAKRKKYGTLAV
jgi:hypothetical protein